MAIIRMKFLGVLLLSILLLTLCSCGKQSGTRAVQGGATGTAAGVVGGLVSALIFGGDVGEAVAYGAVWGASTGAVSGAIIGHQEDKAIKKQEMEQARKKLIKELGEDGYEGLKALVQCKHPVAHSYANLSMNSKKKQYLETGKWLDILAYADAGDTEKANSMLPEVIEIDAGVNSLDEAQKFLEHSLTGVKNIRGQYGLAKTCP